MNKVELDVGGLIKMDGASVHQCLPPPAANLGMGGRTGVAMCVASLLRSKRPIWQ